MTDQIQQLRIKIANDKALHAELGNQIRLDEYTLTLLEDQEKLIKAIKDEQRDKV